MGYANGKASLQACKDFPGACFGSELCVKKSQWKKFKRNVIQEQTGN